MKLIEKAGLATTSLCVAVVVIDRVRYVLDLLWFIR